MKSKELELSEKIERRLEMIHAHTKLGKTIREVLKEFGVCRDTYYHRYAEKGIFGLFDSKRAQKLRITKPLAMSHPRLLRPFIAILSYMRRKY